LGLGRQVRAEDARQEARVRLGGLVLARVAENLAREAEERVVDDEAARRRARAARRELDARRDLRGDLGVPELVLRGLLEVLAGDGRRLAGAGRRRGLVGAEEPGVVGP